MRRKTQMVLLAGGTGERFGGHLPKQFVKIAGRTVIEHTIEQVEQADVIDSIIIVIHKEFYDYMNDIILKNHFHKVKKIIVGGENRQQSSYAGIMASDSDTDNLLFHDAIRPFVSQQIMKDVVKALEQYHAVDVAIPCADTIIEVDDCELIKAVPKRKYLMRGQTPQGFHKELIKQAYDMYRTDDSGVEVTDDCGIVRHYDLADIYVVRGEEQNIKITYVEDAYLADRLFQVRSLVMNQAEPESVFSAMRAKVGIVFGSGSGIGADIVRILQEHGCSVYGFSRSSGYDIRKYQNVEDALQEVFRKEGRIDYCINTAGSLIVRKLEAIQEEELEEMIGTDYLGAIQVAKASIPYLRQTQGCMILFSSSSYTRGRAMYSIYSSAKAAVVNFAQAMAEELYDEKIRVNVINPERTDTPMRRRNFGLEPQETLLDSRQAAWAAICAVNTDCTGQVIDIRKNTE